MKLRTFLTSVGQTDEELIGQIRNLMEDARKNPGETVMAVHGYNDDPRELGEIPEVVEHMKRMVEFGAIAVLTRSTWCSDLGAPEDMWDLPLLGAFEVWMVSLGFFTKVSGQVSIPGSMYLEFRKKVWPAADRALSRNLHKYSHVPPAGPECEIQFGR